MSNTTKEKKCLLLDKHEDMGKRVGKCVFCKVKIGLSFKEREQKKVDAIPLKKKQEFLDALKENNVGDAIKKVDPNKEHESSAWFNVLSQNITTHKYHAINEKAI